MQRSRHAKIRKVCHRRGVAPEFEIDASTRRMRMTLLGVGIFCAAVGIAGRLAWLQGPDRERWADLALRQYQGTINILGARGSIYDRNQRALAASAETLAVGVHPAMFEDKQQAGVELAAVLNLEIAEVQEKLGSSRPFVWLKKGVAVEHRDALQRISRRGVSIIREFSRFYPQGKIAASILGKVGVDGDGLSGIELAFNERLKAEGTTRSVRRDALGNYFRPASVSTEGVGTALRSEGSDVVLTIDAVLQGMLEREVQRGRLNAEARGVYAVLMDAESGEILAAAEDTAGQSAGGKFLRNGIVQNSYEPGSTFKPLVAAAAFDAGLVNASETLNCTKNGRMRVGKHTIRDVHPMGSGTLRDVLVRSSNICMAQLGERLGKERLHDAIRRFGFGEQTGLELQGEAKGILRDVSEWRRIDVATASFGQGLATTAPQLLRAYAALANGGYLVEPHILVSEKAKERKRILKQETAETISQMIAGVVHDEHGTARRAKIEGLTVYGKTGTAQKPSTTSRGYDPEKVLSSFIGFIDGTELGISSKLVLYVAVDEPQVYPRWGGRVAAPVFRRFMERALSHIISTQSTIASRIEAHEERLARVRPGIARSVREYHS